MPKGWDPALPCVVEDLAESNDMLCDDAGLKSRAERDGYLFFRDLVPRDLVDALRDHALSVARDLEWLQPTAPLGAAIGRPGIGLGGYEDPRWIEFLRRVVGHESFAALRSAPELLRVLETLLDGSVEPHAGDILRVVSADDPRHTTLPHQDRHYIVGQGLLWTAWLPLGDCPKRLGPLAVLPGSHQRGLLPHCGDGPSQLGVSVPSSAKWRASDLQPGDVMLFGGLTLHRALPHRSGPRLRLSVDYRYTGAAH